MAWVQLDLFEDVVHLPWNGRSPRALTRCAKALFLRREPQKSVSDSDWLACPRCGRPTRKGVFLNRKAPPYFRRFDDGSI